MTDIVKNVPGYQVSDLPEGVNNAPDFEDLVNDYQVDDDQNGVLNADDAEALDFALELAEGTEDEALLRQLTGAVKDTPTLTLEAPGQRYPDRRDQVQSALEESSWWGQRREAIRELSATQLSEATVAQRAAAIDELAKRGGFAVNQEAAREVMETTPYHRRGALLDAIRSNNDLSFAVSSAPEWVQTATFERPDLDVSARAVRLGQALDMNDAARNVDLLLASMPEEQLEPLAAELISRGTLNRVAAISERGAALKSAAVQAILDDPTSDELQIAAEVGALGLDVATIVQVLGHPRFEGPDGEIWDELAVDEWVSSGAMAPVFEAQGGSIGELLERSRSDYEARAGLASLFQELNSHGQLSDAIESTLVSGYRDYAIAAVDQRREALYQSALQRRAGDENIDDVFPDRELEDALERRLYGSTVRNLRARAQEGVLSEREYRAFADAVRYGDIEDGEALEELADIVTKSFTDMDDHLFDAGEDRYGYDYSSVVNIFAYGQVGANRSLWSSEVAALRELRARDVFREYAHFADGRTIGTVLNLLELGYTPASLGFPTSGGGTPDPTDPPPGGGTPDPTDPPPGGGTPDPTDPPPGGGTPDPTEPPPGGGTPDPTEPPGGGSNPF